jgi:hypothetical protein
MLSFKDFNSLILILDGRCYCNFNRTCKILLFSSSEIYQSVEGNWKSAGNGLNKSRRSKKMESLSLRRMQN